MSFSRNVVFALPIGNKFSGVIEQMNTMIEFADENSILKSNSDQYIELIETRLKIDKPVIDFDGVHVDPFEGDVSISSFPGYYGRTETVKKIILRYIIPISGNIEMLNYMPKRYGLNTSTGDFYFDDKTIVTQITNIHEDPKKTNQDYELKKTQCENLYKELLRDIDIFNNSLRSSINNKFNERKNRVLRKFDFLSKLNVPLKKNENVPNTFAIPQPRLREKIIIEKPKVDTSEIKQEPTLDISNYNLILKTINDIGKNLERMPSIYFKKGEEDLRDLILFVLDPNFVMGSASGETFNKTGKTDILLNYQGSVVFVAECKKWSGPSDFLKAITQLFGYLTWRDSKSSLILFVPNHDISNVVSKIELEITKHSNYLETLKKSDEGWFNFRFHLNNDKGREVKLAVQIFHLPEIK